MANVEYLICSFCQGPSSKSLRSKLEAHLDNPDVHIRQTDLDWLDKWRLLLPAHVEWDIHRLRDFEFHLKYESELPKVNVVSKVQWVPSIEGRISTTPEWDDLDGWRTIEFDIPSAEDEDEDEETATTLSNEFRHLLPPSPTQVGKRMLSKRTLHPYNDDIDATRLPFHSACLQILYECCNEVTCSNYATSTVSDVVHSILIPSWKEGDVNMDWLSRRRAALQRLRLTSPWGEQWHPLDPNTNYLAVDPSRPQYQHKVQSILIAQPEPNYIQSTLLRMPAEVLDLISDFIMDIDTTSNPRPFDSNLTRKVQSLQNLRYTCRQMYHHSFPRIHFLNFLHCECRLSRALDTPLPWNPLPTLHPTQPTFQYPIHIPTQPRPYLKPILPYRRIPYLPPWQQLDRQVMETDWESVYRNWKQGLGWKNRVRMFIRCEMWLGEMQEVIWEGREWGRTANYIVPRQLQQEGQQPVAFQAEGAPQNVPVVPQQEAEQEEENEEMLEVVQPANNDQQLLNVFEQFLWPS